MLLPGSHEIRLETQSSVGKVIAAMPRRSLLNLALVITLASTALTAAVAGLVLVQGPGGDGLGWTPLYGIFTSGPGVAMAHEPMASSEGDQSH